MKKNVKDNTKAMLIIVALLVLTGLVAALPWWSFVVPVALFGVFITFRRWDVSVFLVGFTAGFITWYGGNLFFDVMHNGIVLAKIGLLLSVPKLVVLLASGLIGGLLTWLALYVGQSLLAAGEAPQSGGAVEL